MVVASGFLRLAPGTSTPLWATLAFIPACCWGVQGVAEGVQRVWRMLGVEGVLWLPRLCKRSC